MLVEKLMTGDVESCLASDTLADAAAVMWRRDCGAVPVVDEERRVVGVVTDRDICMALATRGQLATDVRVGDVMTAGPRTCTTADDVREALELMRSRQLRRLPVVDGAGRLAGVLSISDVILHSGKGKSKKHVSHRDVMATLKAISATRDADAKSEGGDREGGGDDGDDKEAGDSDDRRQPADGPEK